MRRLFPLLCAAGLAVAPSPAAAEPPAVETFEWSSVTSRARLGVMVIGITPELRKHFGAAEDRGVLVGRVAPKSAAEAAGLEVGDVLVEVGGNAVDSAGDVLSALAPVKQGEGISLAVIRDRKPLTLHATLTAPAPDRGGAAATPPRWLDDWFDDLRRRFRGPDGPGWFDEMLRPWNEREGGPRRGGAGRSTQT